MKKFFIIAVAAAAVYALVKAVAAKEPEVEQMDAMLEDFHLGIGASWISPHSH